MTLPDKPKPGLLLLNKKPGLTSFDTLWRVKRALATGKVGHTGTLDKFASGLLLVLVGRAAKLTPWFSGCDKRYEACIRFGAETDTLDPEGEIIAEAPLPSRETFEKILPLFTGEILQAPPLYSALHIQGVRAHTLARAGKAVEMKKRPVTIHSLELRSWEPPLAHIAVHCSAGTYIRSLARDIALAAESRAHLSALVRTGIAGFSLDEAWSPAAGPHENEEFPVPAPSPIDTGVFDALGIPWLRVDETAAGRMLKGRNLNGGDFPFLPEVAAPYSLGIFRNAGKEGPEDVFVGIVEKKDPSWKYGYVNAGN